MRRSTLAIAGLLAAALIALVAIAGTRTGEPTDREDDEPAPDATGDDQSPPRIADSDTFSLPPVLVNPAIRIEKSRRSLVVISGDRPVKTYRIALGSSPTGDKEREGDRTTPVGEFYVCTRNPESHHTRALGLSYPTAVHAQRGLDAGLIGKRDYRTIIDALRRFRQPPWNTALGGEIMIHGGGSGRGDWTAGCIALDDDDVLELFDAIPLGTPVEIAE